MRDKKSGKTYLTVGELRRLLQSSIEPCDIPDDAPVVLLGSDHSYVTLTPPCIEEADGSIGTGLGEADPGVEQPTTKVLVFGR